MQPVKDYSKDIAEIRSMMEKSSKFLSLSGWAGIMVGVYALAGVAVAKYALDFSIADLATGHIALTPQLTGVMALGVIVLVIAIVTSIVLSVRKARGKQLQLWNPTAKRLLVSMAVPLVSGGMLILILIAKGLFAYVVPVSLIFYGLALFNTGKFTYNEIGTLGLIEIALGLLSAYFIDYGMAIWAFGFGVLHIIFGVYLHYKYEN